MREFFVGRKQSIGELLDVSGPPIVVPEWQRHFSWSTAEVEGLWLHLLAFAQRLQTRKAAPQGHSLGAVRLARHENLLILLDGQNRLATATILLSVIRDFAARFSGYEAVRIQERYIRKPDPATGSAFYKLTLNRFDERFFQQEIQDAPPGGRQTPEPQIESHRFIWRARNVLLDWLEKQCGSLGDGEAPLERALQIQLILTEHTMVDVSLSEWTTTMRYPVSHP